MASPSLSGFDAPTFGEDAVNATPQVIDSDVTFTDADDDFDGGTLTVKGILAEDTVSVRNQGTGAGEIGLSGSDVTYGGVVIGTLAGGAGATLTITFNAAATSEAIDALIQNLTYANSSDRPTASRDLLLNITDAAGNDLGASGPAVYTELTGADNPFVGVNARQSTPSLVDLDNDGDLDAVVGAQPGRLQYYENTGSNTAPVFVRRTDGANPLDGVNTEFVSAPTFADLDADGDLDAVVGAHNGTIYYYRNTGSVSAPAFTQQTGGANPFNGIDTPYTSRPTLADLDGDNDLDAVIGASDGTLRFYENTGTALAPVFESRTGGDNPFNGVDVGYSSSPTLVDLDGDGDMDVVVGENYGKLNYFENTGTALAPVFVERTGASNPVDDIASGSSVAPVFGDLDGDGDLDAVIGQYFPFYGLRYVEFGPIRGQTITVTVNAENDAPQVTGLPTDVTVIEEVASDLDLSGLTLTDPDTDDITVVLTASSGTLTASSDFGVTVTNSGTGAITLTGPASAIGSFLTSASTIQYTSAPGVSGDNAATVTITADDGSGAVELGVVNVDITPPPVRLNGFGPSATFLENAVNGGPQLLDADVVFTSNGSGFDGGRLTVSGLLAEDSVSVRNQGTGAGEIGLSGADVTFAGEVIGALAGGSGAVLTITFNASATAEAIDALIQNLTYANSSNTPTTSRTLSINVTNAAGDSLGGAPAFTLLSGGDNPFSGIDSGDLSASAFADLDGDGDLDAVVGNYWGPLLYLENTGTALAPAFTQRTGLDNPFDGMTFNGKHPTLADLDGDGDQDAVFTDSSGNVRYLENTGTAAAPEFTERTGGTNPFSGTSLGYGGAATLADLDGDGDLDAVLSMRYGSLGYLENTGTALAPAFTQRTGLDNPVDGIDFGSFKAPTFTDMDGDGDLDLIVGARDGKLHFFENTGTAAAPVFVSRTGEDNPFDSFDLGDGHRSTPTFADLDGDGDLDAVSGDFYGGLFYLENTTVSGPSITVTVTDEADAPSLTGLPTDVTVIEDVVSKLDLSAVTLGDLDNTGEITMTMTVSVGAMTAVDSKDVTVSGSGTGTLVLAGTRSAIDNYLDNATYYIEYTGALNASGDNAATLIVTANDGIGSGDVNLGTVNIDITAVNDAPTLTGFATAVTFAENTVNATPQLLDADVTFADAEGNFNGGTLALSGLLAEDRASVRNEGTDAGQIGLAGTDVTFGGVIIGALAGGVGGTLTITFNASATSEAIDALIQNLTYANVSDTPIASRDLRLVVTEAAGGTYLGAPTFTERTGAANPFDGVEFDRRAGTSFGDLDDDGDLDALVGQSDGSLRYFENTGTVSAPVFVQRTDGDSPFTGINVGFRSIPDLVDLDGDGDLDAVIGNRDGFLTYFENTGTAQAPVFVERTGEDNPLPGADFSYYAAAAFADLDGDGDLDLVVGENYGSLRYFENTGTVADPAFTERTGGTNPFDGVNVGGLSVATFGDVDGDGDLDALIGANSGTLNYFENTGTTMAPVFTERTGGDNPFDDFGFSPDGGGTLETTPEFVDLDGDGDLDVMVGHFYGRLNYLENITVLAPSITVTVTAESDAQPMTLTGLEPSVTFLENFVNAAPHRLDADVVFSGAGHNFNGGSLAVSGLLAEDRVSVNHQGAGAGEIGLAGADVSYGGVVIGSLAGGVGGALTITFNANATSAAIDALIQNLTYANVSDAPTESRSLEINVFNASGDNLGGLAPSITVTVTSQNEPVTGTAAGETVLGDALNDQIDGGDGDDFIDGGSGNDLLIGGDGGDYLRGGEGADTMTGGTGNDTYVVDNAGDTTDETGGDGIDLVHSRFNWTLGSGLENLTLGNGGAWSGTGNTGGNVITGNSLANVISGLAGNDTLNGGGGDDILNGGDDDDTLNGDTQNDTLNGGAGADILNGGAHNDALDGGTGADTMIGGTGHDSYVVDDAGDVVTEDAGIGTGADTVSASISYSLTANVENLTLTGSGDLNGTGNGLANTLTGNSGANTLSGGDGADVLNGLEGNDALNGEAGNDTLDGGADNDVLTGGAGQDRLTGGAGADAFVFINADIRRTGPGFGLAADKDVILDLSFAGGDRIDLSAIDANAILAGDQAFTFVSNFTGVAGQATLKFISGKSVLQLDVDGDSKADLLVEINGNITGTTTNLYTGGGDVNGGWVL